MGQGGSRDGLLYAAYFFLLVRARRAAVASVLAPPVLSVPSADSR